MPSHPRPHERATRTRHEAVHRGAATTVAHGRHIVRAPGALAGAGGTAAPTGPGRGGAWAGSPQCPAHQLYCPLWKTGEYSLSCFTFVKFSMVQVYSPVSASSASADASGLSTAVSNEHKNARGRVGVPARRGRRGRDHARRLLGREGRVRRRTHRPYRLHRAPPGPLAPQQGRCCCPRSRRRQQPRCLLPPLRPHRSRAGSTGVDSHEREAPGRPGGD